MSEDHYQLIFPPLPCNVNIGPFACSVELLVGESISGLHVLWSCTLRQAIRNRPSDSHIKVIRIGHFQKNQMNRLTESGHLVKGLESPKTEYMGLEG